MLLSRKFVSDYIDLPNDLTINGDYSEQGCTLDPSLHRIILKYAVNLAAAAWTDTK